MNVLLSMVTENVETMHVVPNMEVFGGLTDVFITRIDASSCEQFFATFHTFCCNR